MTAAPGQGPSCMCALVHTVSSGGLIQDSDFGSKNRFLLFLKGQFDSSNLTIASWILLNSVLGQMDEMHHWGRCLFSYNFNIIQGRTESTVDPITSVVRVKQRTAEPDCRQKPLRSRQRASLLHSLTVSFIRVHSFSFALQRRDDIYHDNSFLITSEQWREEVLSSAEDINVQRCFFFIRCSLSTDSKKER